MVNCKYENISLIPVTQVKAQVQWQWLDPLGTEGDLDLLRLTSERLLMSNTWS